MSKELNKIMGMVCERERMYYNAAKVDALLADKDAEIAELKQKLEDVNELIKTARKMLEDAKATAYAESVDAGMENRRLKRALWLARAERARTEQCYENYSFYIHRHQKTMYGGTYRPYIAWLEKWIEVERKCRAKSEEWR